MPAPTVYIGHASPSDDAVCLELVAALRGAGVPQLHYEQFTPQTGILTVVVVGELHSRPVNIYLLSPAMLTSSMGRQFAEDEHTLCQREPLRILLPVTVAQFSVGDLWPFLAGYRRVEKAPGQPYPAAETIRRTLETLALAPVSKPSGLGRLFGGGGAHAMPDPLIGAKSLHWQGANVEAVGALDQLTKDQPQLFEAWYALAVLHEELKRAPEALAAYDRALALDGTNPYVWVKKGYLLDQQGQYQAGLEACDRALALDPNLAIAWYTKGYILDDLSRLDEALTAYQRAQELDPTFVAGWSNMGITLRKMGRLEEAKAAQERAVELDDGFAPAWVNLANVLIDLQSYEEALAATEKALARDANNPVYLYTKARALIGLQRHAEAMTVLTPLYTFAPALELRARLQRALQSRG